MVDFFATLLLITIFGSIFLAFFAAPLLKLALAIMYVVFYLTLGIGYALLWVLKLVILFLVGPIAFIVYALAKFIGYLSTKYLRQPQQ